MTQDPRPAISFHNLTLGYDRHPAVHHITGDVARGELLALVGPNGAGKSTLLKGIVGQIKPLSGSLSLDGLKLREIAYLPQQIDIDRSFPITVFDAVAMGLWHEIGTWRGVDARPNRCRARCTPHARLARPRRPHRRRALRRAVPARLFARLLLQDAAIILLDEPFRAVDTKTVDDLLRLISRWHQEGRTVIAALHDLDQVRAHFPRTLLLAREVVAWGPTKQVLTPKNLAKSRQLTEAWDEHAEICERGERVSA